MKTTNTLEATRLWISITKSQHALKFGKISYFWNIVALPQPLAKGFIVSVIRPPFFFIALNDVSPPPRMNIEMINGTRDPIWIYF
jgi:hypothetical protein